MTLTLIHYNENFIKENHPSIDVKESEQNVFGERKITDTHLR